MDKFTKVIKKQSDNINIENVVYQDDYIVVKKENDFSYITEKDKIVILPYLKSDGYVYLRTENIYSWIDKYQNKNLKKDTKFLTLITGTIEDNETPAQTLRRELYEEAGIVVNQFYQFNIEGPYFYSKGSTSQYYLCLLELNYNDYKITAPVGDGSEFEKTARNLKIAISELEHIKINDLITKMLLDKLKNDYNL